LVKFTESVTGRLVTVPPLAGDVTVTVAGFKGGGSLWLLLLLDEAPPPHPWRRRHAPRRAVPNPQLPVIVGMPKEPREFHASRRNE
jgi:hypothetical protein